MAADLGEFAAAGWLNIVGGCCGTTPEHIRRDRRGRARRARRACRRTVEPLHAALAASSRSSIRPDIELRQHRRAHQRHRLAEVREARSRRGSTRRRSSVARQQVENGANVIDVNMDEGMIDGEQAMTRFLNLLAAEPDIASVPIMIDSSKWAVIEAGLQVPAGQGHRQLDPPEGRRGRASASTPALVRRYGAAVVVMAFDEQGQADDGRAQGRDLPRAPTAS